MKIYEALKAMIKNGKTIQEPGNFPCTYKMGETNWEKIPVILRKFKSSHKWEISSIHIDNKEIVDDWEVVEEVKDER